VPNVHRLGDVWRRVIDDDALARVKLFDAVVRIARNLPEAVRQKLVFQKDVDVAWTGNLCFGDDGMLGNRRQHKLRQITRLLSKRLRKLETGVDLQVAKLRL
jgi:hypothetical protein